MAASKKTWAEAGRLFPAQSGQQNHFAGYINLGILGRIRVIARPPFDATDGRLVLLVEVKETPLGILDQITRRWWQQERGDERAPASGDPPPDDLPF